MLRRILAARCIPQIGIVQTDGLLREAWLLAAAQQMSTNESNAHLESSKEMEAELLDQEPPLTTPKKRPPYRLVTNKQRELDSLVLDSAFRMLERSDDSNSWESIIESREQRQQSGMDEYDDVEETVAVLTPDLLDVHQTRIAKKAKESKKEKQLYRQALVRWLEANDEDLKPFREFVSHYRLPGDYIISSLFQKGNRSRAALLPVEEDEVDDTLSDRAFFNDDSFATTSREAQQGDDDATDEEEESNNTIEEEEESNGNEAPQDYRVSRAELHFDQWYQILQDNQLTKVHLERVVSKNPRILAKSPDPRKLNELFSLLLAVLNNDTVKLQKLIMSEPIVLSYNVMGLQNQLLFLTLHFPAVLSELITKDPSILIANRLVLEKNVQFLTENLASIQDFTALVLRQPALLRVRNLAARYEATVVKVKSVLPEHISAKALLQAEPDLLVNPRKIRVSNGWMLLHMIAQEVPAWKQELDDVLAGKQLRVNNGGIEADDDDTSSSSSSDSSSDSSSSSDSEEEEESAPKKTVEQNLAKLISVSFNNHWRLRYLTEMGYADSYELSEALLMRQDEFEEAEPEFIEWSLESKRQRKERQDGTNERRRHYRR